MLALGKLFQYGDIVQEDHESAIYWYEKAEQAGNDEADEYIKSNEIDEYLFLVATLWKQRIMMLH